MILKDVVLASERLREGDVIAYPTETVYGLGACIFDNKGVDEIFSLKGRDNKKPISVAISSYESIEELAVVTKDDWKIINSLLPGPYTLLFKKKKIVPDSITCDSHLIGIRFPLHQLAQRLIDITGPITSTSANLSGKQPPVKPSEIDIPVRYILDGGQTQYSTPSTIIDTVKKEVVREGAALAKAWAVLHKN